VSVPLRDRDDLRDVLRRPYAARILLSAVELDLFGPCVPGPATVEGVAERCGTEPRATGVMLDALVGLGLVDKGPGGYRAGVLAARHLAAHSPEPLHGMVSHYLLQWERWSRLSEVVRSGGPLPRDGQRASTMRDFARAMDDGKAHVPSRRLLPMPLEGVRRVVDLGGGPGTMAVALARELPEVQVDLVDRAAVLAVARERVPAELWGVRVHPIEADLCRWGPAPGRYDLAILSAVLHGYGGDEAAAMVARAARGLAPGGRLVVRELLVDDPEPARALDAAVFSVGMLINTAHGRSFTRREISDWMVAAGLEEPSLVPVERGLALVGRRASS
jgi:SAM-dependent methyltransferase